MRTLLSNATRPEDLVYNDPRHGWSVNRNPFVGADDPQMDAAFGSDKRAAILEAESVFKVIQEIRNA